MNRAARKSSSTFVTIELSAYPQRYFFHPYFDLKYGAKLLTAMAASS
jgi:hypothetical protein